jgi:hypothetical protein
MEAFATIMVDHLETLQISGRSYTDKNGRPMLQCLIVTATMLRVSDLDRLVVSNQHRNASHPNLVSKTWIDMVV